MTNGELSRLEAHRDQLCERLDQLMDCPDPDIAHEFQTVAYQLNEAHEAVISYLNRVTTPVHYFPISQMMH